MLKIICIIYRYKAQLRGICMIYVFIGRAQGTYTFRCKVMSQGHLYDIISYTFR